MMEYKIVMDYSASDLEETIREYLARGWVPLGGVCAISLRREHQTTSVVLYQTMIRHPPGGKNPQ